MPFFYCLKQKKNCMIYNKALGITDEDVSQENNLETLYIWKRSIDIQITELLKSVDNWQRLSQNGKTLYKCLFSFKKIIACRIRELKMLSGYRSERSLRKDRTLSMIFMQKAKNILDKETYKKILSASQAEMVD